MWIINCGIFRNINTFRYLPNNYSHCTQHKIEGIHEKFEREKKTIRKIPEFNDYFSNIVDKIIRKKRL